MRKKQKLNGIVRKLHKDGYHYVKYVDGRYQGRRKWSSNSIKRNDKKLELELARPIKWHKPKIEKPITPVSKLRKIKAKDKLFTKEQEYVLSFINAKKVNRTKGETISKNFDVISKTQLKKDYRKLLKNKLSSSKGINQTISKRKKYLKDRTGLNLKFLNAKGDIIGYAYYSSVLLDTDADIVKFWRQKRIDSNNFFPLLQDSVNVIKSKGHDGSFSKRGTIKKIEKVYHFA